MTPQSPLRETLRGKHTINEDWKGLLQDISKILPIQIQEYNYYAGGELMVVPIDGVTPLML